MPFAYEEGNVGGVHLRSCLGGGDLVIFHNQGVLHSITGQLKDEKRLMWQCIMASSAPPERYTRE